MDNILFLFPDQLRRDFLSCYGADFIDTPNIDWIAEHGVRYDNAYSASPLCVPARTALLTGMNAVRNGVTDNLHAIRPDYNLAGIRTWPQIMAENGYYTAAVGKMHFYPWDARHGFQYRVVCEDKLWSLIRDDYYHYLKSHGLRKLRWFEYGEYLESKGVAHTDVPWEHSWDRYTGREARRFIETQGNDGPFALMVGFPGPHDPYDPATDFPDKYRSEDMPGPIPASDSHGHILRESRIHARANMGMDLSTYTENEMRYVRAHYAGLVKQIDHEVGELIQTLRRNDLLDSTVIVFATDHGDHLGDHGIEGKATFYESATHIPLLVRAPGNAEGTTCLDLVELRDVTATILALAGCDLPDYMDAQPLPTLGLEGPSPRTHIFGYLTQSWMAFDGRYKLAKYSSATQGFEPSSDSSNSHTDPWKQHDMLSRGETHLFDLQNDPNEQHNLLDTNSILSPGDSKIANIFHLLDTALTQELMSSMTFAMHDRMPLPYSMSSDENVAREGWVSPFPSSASAGSKVQDPY